MTEEATTEAPEREAAAPEAEKPAKKQKAAKADTIKARVLRDYWTKGDGSEDDRVRAGTIIEVTTDALIDGIENGILERVKA